MDSNERIDEAIELLNSLIEVKRYNIDAFDMVRILRILKAPELPKETSGYSTNKDELEWAHDETGHLIKIPKKVSVNNILGVINAVSSEEVSGLDRWNIANSIHMYIYGKVEE